MVRRLLAIVLFAAALLPALAPVLLAGSVAASSLPMCCRRNGAHHCEGTMAMAQLTSGETMVRPPQMKCPFQQRSLGAVHLSGFAFKTSPVESVGVLGAPSVAAQAECLRRIAFDRARQKRGPPFLKLS